MFHYHMQRVHQIDESTTLFCAGNFNNSTGLRTEKDRRSIFGDTRRTLRQAELTLRLTTPLEGQAVFGMLGGPRLRTELRSFTQRSNISLFDINEWQLQFSLVWNFQK